ncbi:MAG TPA: carboxypeptidase-like regulatory domain-containing protein [Gemmatimonadaceae bacterium]|nr:carboxypeptidase-like regulatory domain-containing protein [Gemmatimonadaceae bacterium]
MPRFGLLLLLLTTATAPLRAQVIRGTLTQAGSDAPLADAVVTITDTARITLDETRTNAAGRFLLDARNAGRVLFVVRKVGAQPTESDVVQLPGGRDTIDLEIAAPLVGVRLATVRVIGENPARWTFNQNMLREARQSGWRVIAPERIERERGTAQSMGDLLRRLPLASVRPPDGGQGCYYYVRTGRCLSLVVDGQVLGANAFVSPNDVYFIALLTPSQATIAYGPRARDGALFIATRRQADERQRPPQ